MGTPDNPDVLIQYYDQGVGYWRELITFAKSFTVKDAGVLKIPQLDNLLLLNPDYLPAKNDRMRIQVATATAGKLIFYGKASEITLIPKSDKLKYYNIVGYGLEKRFKNDTITWKYGSEQSAHGALWTYKSMIEDFLVLPDSGYDTNVTLETDSNEILNYVAKSCDFSRRKLRDALRKISEIIYYDGYIYIDESDNAILKYVKLGTLDADPAITIEEPFIGKPQLIDSIDEIKNYILVWGGVDKGYPSDRDRFSERGFIKFNPRLWEGLDGETVYDTQFDSGTSSGSNGSNSLKDTSKSWTTDEWKAYTVIITNGTGKGQIRKIFSNTQTELTVYSSWTTIPDNTSKYEIIFGNNTRVLPSGDNEDIENVIHTQLSRYCMKTDKGGSDYTESLVRFHIDRTGVSSLDFQKRYSSVCFSMFPYDPDSRYQVFTAIILTDINGDKVRKGGLYSNNSNWHAGIGGTLLHRWTDLSFPTFVVDDEIHGHSHPSDWYYIEGSTQFDPTQVKTLDIKMRTQGVLKAVYFDFLFFAGGLKIEPFENPEYYPSPAVNGAVLDPNSIGAPNNYGVSLYHHHDRDITSFEEAVSEGSRILSILKEPTKGVTVTKKGLEWLRPHQNVTLNSPNMLGISNEIWRTVELNWDWKSNFPVYCTAKLVPQNAHVPPVYAPSGEIPARSSMPRWDGWFGRPKGKLASL